MRSDEFLRQFAGGKSQKPRVTVEGDVLIEWSYRAPVLVRVLTVLLVVALLLGYYALKHFRGFKMAPLDVVVTFVFFIFAGRFSTFSKNYSMTTVGVYEKLGGNWRNLGNWKDFKSCRREEKKVILEKRKGFPRTIRLSCPEKSKVFAVLNITNEQINKHRWR
ncbi:hypothetical protein E3J38_06775 [candidate division TA06 bacterium]|uniref:Uncharacterized protein n=1 Tax=candidate division TA06 bacterium TaxID=2250710 RepID=A0A523XKF0_UNCT6|nr:MAG: hypothetical protein E3J38_06775 [candidate division TA06 bacterium]